MLMATDCAVVVNMEYLHIQRYRCALCGVDMASPSALEDHLRRPPERGGHWRNRKTLAMCVASYALSSRGYVSLHVVHKLLHISHP